MSPWFYISYLLSIQCHIQATGVQSQSQSQVHSSGVQAVMVELSLLHQNEVGRRFHLEEWWNHHRSFVLCNSIRQCLIYYVFSRPYVCNLKKLCVAYSWCSRLWNFMHLELYPFALSMESCYVCLFRMHFLFITFVHERKLQMPKQEEVRNAFAHLLSFLLLQMQFTNEN